MSVKLLAKPALIRCPKCNTQVRLPASPAASTARPSPQPSPQPTPPRSTTPQPATRPKVAPVAPQPASAGIDLGQLDLGAPPPAMGSPLSPHAARPNPAARSSSATHFTGRLLSWINGHRMATAVIGLNVIVLVMALFSSPWRMFALFEVPLGALILGALFLPRFHLMDRVAKVIGAIGGKLAGAGVGGVLLVILAVAAKATSRIMRKSRTNENLDFSGFLDLSNLGSFAASLATFLVVCAAVFLLWKLFGIVRVMASGYLAQLTLLAIILLLNGSFKSQHTQDFERRHAEAVARMERDSWSPPQNPRQRAFGPRPENRSAVGQPPPKLDEQQLRPMQPGEIRVIFMHPPDTAIDELRDRFLAKLGNPDCETQQRLAMQSHFIVQTDRDPKEVSEAIDFGRVATVNQVARLIVVVPQTRKTN
ncbi:hypothetical protein NHH03_06740 [Stieleria sp. TO1_6]|uniref:hypothetical protein n=1 Tax=Stieleria tagensis TaxID=2956795 RepID=UPI00209B99A7|nr:hypothetical protein [Stieleria tagensis]MCO8121428.1 hypothetical protein [Stieleria tagensis]